MLTNWFQTGITPSLAKWTGLIHGVAGTTVAASGAGTLVGYSRPGWYNAAAPAGSLDTDLFVDRRNPGSPRTVRIMGLVKQSTGFIVLGWKAEPTIPPSESMPSMLSTLKIFGYDLTFASGSVPGIESGTEGLYWNVASVPMVSGEPFTFEFV